MKLKSKIDIVNTVQLILPESEDEFDDKHCTNISTGTVKSEHEETGEYVIEEQFQHTSTNADPDIESSTRESIEYEELDAKDQSSAEEIENNSRNERPKRRRKRPSLLAYWQLGNPTF